jgi:hypothetical protein
MPKKKIATFTTVTDYIQTFEICLNDIWDDYIADQEKAWKQPLDDEEQVIFALEREYDYERWDPEHDYAEADCPYEGYELADLINKFKTYLKGGETNATN